MLPVNKHHNMLSGSILNEKSLLSVITLLIICCTLHKLVVKKKKSVFKRNQMINCCCFNHYWVHCYSHTLSTNPWNNTQTTMANMLVAMRGEKQKLLFFEWIYRNCVSNKVLHCNLPASIWANIQLFCKILLMCL